MSESATQGPSPPGSRWFRLASWMFIVLAAGHTIGNHVVVSAPPPDKARVLAEMNTVIEPLSGGLHRTMTDFATGDSLSVGLLWLAFGVGNLLFERARRRRGFAVPSSVSGFNAAIAAANIVVAARFFFPGPVVFLTVALVGFSAAWLRARTATPATAPAS